MNIITKKALSRRTVLRGMGTMVALPLLGAMVPALTATREDGSRSDSAAGFFLCTERNVPAELPSQR